MKFRHIFTSLAGAIAGLLGRDKTSAAPAIKVPTTSSGWGEGSRWTAASPGSPCPPAHMIPNQRQRRKANRRLGFGSQLAKRYAR